MRQLGDVLVSRLPGSDLEMQATAAMRKDGVRNWMLHRGSESADPRSAALDDGIRIVCFLALAALMVPGGLLTCSIGSAKHSREPEGVSPPRPW